MKKAICMLAALCLLLGSAACAGNVPPAGQADAAGDGAQILVAYFSCTGNTQAVAELIAEAAGATLYEITPQTPYSEDDLNYRDNTTRSSIEMNDPTARPAIAGSVAGMEQYDVVFVGYPLWWGVAPRIVSTFIESYAFSGKTVIAFCTSGSSGFGASDAALREAAPDAVWLEGRRFDAGVSAEEIGEWLEALATGQPSLPL